MFPGNFEYAEYLKSPRNRDINTLLKQNNDHGTNSARILNELLQKGELVQINQIFDSEEFQEK